MNNRFARFALAIFLVLGILHPPALLRAQMFAPAVEYGVGEFPEDVNIADFNGDGFLDLVTANSSTDDVSVLPNHGDGLDEVIAGRGPDPEADTEIKVFTYDGTAVIEWMAIDAFTGLTHGTTVAAGWL